MVDEQTATTPTEAKAPEGFEVDFVREFMTQRQGKWFVAYAGLLHLAHERGLVGIEVNILQFPTADNGQTCICRADVRLEAGGKAHTFSEIGDANAGNVGKQMIPHIIRMAATRAKSRALRDAVDIGVTALEELADADEGETKGPPQVRQGQPQARPQQPANGKPITYVSLKIKGKDYQVPEAFTKLDERAHEDYAHWVEKVWAADLETLAEVATAIGQQRAVLDEAVYEQIVRVGKARKQKLQEALRGK